MTFALRADRTRSFALRLHGGCLRAFHVIAGRPALLQRIHVEVEERFPLPSVKWADVYGTDPENGTPISERILRE
jgi:hypothetical protein